MRYFPTLVLVFLGGCVISHPIGATGEEEAQESGPETMAADATAVVIQDPQPSRLPWREIGRSVQDRPILMMTVGRGPRHVIWVGGIHGDEREGRVTTERLSDAFRTLGNSIDDVTLHIVQDANPDGTALARRGNANNVDLNRNYPAKNFDLGNPRFGGEPLSQPEARVLHDLILRVQPDLVVVSHAWRGDHFINFDGPAERLAILFETLSRYTVRRSANISPTPGSLGSWVGVDLGIPILTVEYQRGIDPEEAWNQTRIALLGVIIGN